MHQTIFTFLIAMGVSLAGAGCDGPGENAVPEIPEDRLCERSSAAIGDYLVRCFGPELQLGVGAMLDAEGIREYLETYGSGAVESYCRSAILPRIERGVVKYHPDVATSVVAAAEHASCSELIARFAQSRSLMGLDVVVSGLQEEGAACSDSMECVEGLWCAEASGAEPCSGTCVRFAGDGAPCAAADQQCGPGLACDEDTDVCKPHASVGEACDSLPCDQGLVCGKTSRTCVPAVDVGGVCVEGEGACLASVCAQETCIPLPGVGEHCDARPCYGGLCSEGECIAFPDTGSACIPTAFQVLGWGGGCAAGHHCAQGADGSQTCLTVEAWNSACGVWHDCETMACSDGACSHAWYADSGFRELGLFLGTAGAVGCPP